MEVVKVVVVVEVKVVKGVVDEGVEGRRRMMGSRQVSTRARNGSRGF